MQIGPALKEAETTPGEQADTRIKLKLFGFGFGRRPRPLHNRYTLHSNERLCPLGNGRFTPQRLRNDRFASCHLDPECGLKYPFELLGSSGCNSVSEAMSVVIEMCIKYLGGRSVF